MKLDRLPHEPGVLLDFFEEGLGALGAVCERSWHDRLQLVAEGDAARLWREDGELLETELHFSPADASGPRRADTEVFPGCPLTFRLAEALRPRPMPLERVVLRTGEASRPPASEAAEKMWHGQFPNDTRWRQETSFRPGWHFSLVLLARCEIQAIDQHWSLHRLALSLPDLGRDESLAQALDFAQAEDPGAEPVPWPRVDPAGWRSPLQAAIEEELRPQLEGIRARQEKYLQRELGRINDYFSSYEAELQQRQARAHSDSGKARHAERLAAARAEHERRRQDQVHRHEIRVVPHWDTLLLTAEAAWQTTVSCVRDHRPRRASAHWVPRARRWCVREWLEL